MRKSGGIIAIIAGVLGLLAAALTLMLGGLGAAFQADRANSIIGLGWDGIFFCFLIIVFGAIAINAKSSKMPGILIVISSLLGAVFGGKLVAVLMVLAFVGGILTLLSSSITDTTSKVTVNEVNTASEWHETAVNTSSKAMRIFYVVVAIMFYFIYSSSENKHQAVSTPENKNVSTLIAESDPLKKLDETQPSDLSPIGELPEIFSYGSDYTDLQRENKFNEIHGKIIAWQLPVYDIKRSGDGYTIQTNSHYKNDLFGQILVGTFVHVIARNVEEENLIASLKTGDIVSFKGVIDDSTMRNLDIKPAILVIEHADPSAEAAVEQVAPNEAASVLAIPGEYSIPHAEQTLSFAPSFDCSKATSKADALICSDEELAKLDNELAVLYKQAKSVALDKVAFKKVNYDEWRKREKTCKDRDCLLAWYSNRRSQLNEVIGVEATTTATEMVPVAASVETAVEAPSAAPPAADPMTTYCEDMSKTVSYDQRQIFITNCLISARASEKLMRSR